MIVTHSLRIIQIAGGTGITPLVQLLSHKQSLPAKITLIYAASTQEKDLVPHLLPQDSRMTIHRIHGRLTGKDISQLVGPAHPERSTQIIVCGPDG